VKKWNLSECSLIMMWKCVFLLIMVMLLKGVVRRRLVMGDVVLIMV